MRIVPAIPLARHASTGPRCGAAPISHGRADTPDTEAARRRTDGRGSGGA